MTPEEIAARYPPWILDIMLSLREEEADEHGVSPRA